MNAENSSVFDLEREWQPDPISRIAGGIKIDGAFDAMKTGNRQAGVIDESLVSSDRVFDSAESRPVQYQFSTASEFFNKFHHESGPLKLEPLPRLVCCYFPIRGGMDATSTKYREASFMDGVVTQFRQNFVELEHHPVCATMDASRHFLDRAATPPRGGGKVRYFTISTALERLAKLVRRSAATELPGFLEQFNDLLRRRNNRIVLGTAGIQGVGGHLPQDHLELFFVSATAVSKARHLNIII
jgi:hypothetical protein